MGHLYHGYVSNNQRVAIDRGHHLFYVLKVNAVNLQVSVGAQSMPQIWALYDVVPPR